MIVSLDTLDPQSKSEYVDAGKEKGLEVLELKDGKSSDLRTCAQLLTICPQSNLLAQENLPTPFPPLWNRLQPSATPREPLPPQKVSF